MAAPTHCVRDPLKIPVLICPASSPSPAAPTKKYGALMTVDETASGRSIQPALGFTTFRTLLTPLACKGCQFNMFNENKPGEMHCHMYDHVEACWATSRERAEVGLLAKCGVTKQPGIKRTHILTLPST